MVNGVKLTAGIILSAAMSLMLAFSFMSISPFSLNYFQTYIFYFGLLVVGILLLIDGAREQRL